MVKTGETPGADNAGDIYSVEFHGFTHTHIDALCHLFQDGWMFNGYSQREVTGNGAAKPFRSRDEGRNLDLRGVLMDFPHLFGEKYLKADRAIYPEDIDAWQKETRVAVGLRETP